MREYRPIFNLSDKMIKLLTEISEEVGRVGVLFSPKVSEKFYKENMIKRIYFTLAIEDSKISLEQVRDIITGECFDHSDLRIVKNLYDVYDMLFRLNPYSISDLLFVHKILLVGFSTETAEFREDRIESDNSRSFENDMVPARFVPGAMRDVFDWYKTSELHPLIKSIIVYSELEIIQPFAEGSGLISRIWLDLLLCNWKDTFSFLVVEEEIYKRIHEYKGLMYSFSRRKDINGFVEFVLEIILNILRKIKVDEKLLEDKLNNVMKPKAPISNTQKEHSINENVFAKRLVDVLGDEILSTNEIMLRLGMNHKPTFRKNYLNPAIEMGMVEMTVPSKPRSKNQRYRKIS